MPALLFLQYFLYFVPPKLPFLSLRWFFANNNSNNYNSNVENNNANSNLNSNSGTNSNSSNVSENKNQVEKIDNKQDFVYDASYSYNVPAENYMTDGGRNCNVKDIKVPYININSDDAKEVNEKIKNVFNSAISVFSEGCDNKISYVDKCSYNSYVNGNVLSVILTYGVGGTDVVYPDYYAYNFDLEDGDLLSYDDVYETVGYNENSVDIKVKKEISSYLNSQFSSVPNLDEYTKKSENYYDEAVDDDKIMCYIDQNKKLNVITNVYFPAGREYTQKVFTIN